MASSRKRSIHTVDGDLVEVDIDGPRMNGAVIRLTLHGSCAVLLSLSDAQALIDDLANVAAEARELKR